jgi:predicted SprT family Zn-dependent metalloprotease
MIQILLIVFIICVIGIIVTLVWIYIEPPAGLKVRDLKIGRKKFIELTLKWCSAHLGTTKHPYRLKIIYYRHQVFGGRYLFHGREIVIYVYDSLDVDTLVEIVIHEYSHYLQFQKKFHEQDYDKKHNELGYENNPYEIDARQIAKQKKKECLNWVLGEIRKSWLV